MVLLRHGCALGLMVVAVPAVADAPPTDSDMHFVLVQHNLHRCMHGVQPLQWDNGLALGAQQWADQGHLHTSDEKCGENLLIGQDVTGLQVTEHWYKEVEQTDQGNVQTFNAKTGHYTQMVWNATTHIGCGRSIVSGSTFWVCRYTPEGNIPGDFQGNVGPVLENASCARSTESIAHVNWAFGESDACTEVGKLTVKRRGNSLINVMGYGVEEYTLVSFSVSKSNAGLPQGSTDDGQYELANQSPDSESSQTTVQVIVVTQEMHFSGRSADADGMLHVKSASGKELVMGRDLGRAGSTCEAPFFFLSDQSVISKAQVFGVPVLVGQFELLGLPIHLPVGPVASCIAIAVCTVLVSFVAVLRFPSSGRRSSPEYIDLQAQGEA